MDNIIAPVVIFTYTRFEHLRQTVDSLSACVLADQTELFVFSDAPASSEDSHLVAKVRSYLSNISGFKSVTIIEREFNLGSFANIREGSDFVFSLYDRAIIMEDDLVVGNNFLTFINEGLATFEKDPKILGICAHLQIPLDRMNIESPFVASWRSGYGVGVWRDKERILHDVLLNSDLFHAVMTNFKLFLNFIRGSVHGRSLPSIVYGGAKYGDIQIGIVMNFLGFRAVYPPVNMVKNIGFDGSGVHSGTQMHLSNQKVHNFYVSNSNSELPDNSNFRLIVTKQGFFIRFFLDCLVYFIINFIPFGFKIYSNLKTFWKFSRSL